MNVFVFPVAIAFLVCVMAYVFGGTGALLTVALLAVLETSLSFDNAVINAKTLRQMDATWQRRFLVWGIPIAVFGTRVVLPIVIVAAASFLSPLEVARLALFEPTAYWQYLEHAHSAIASFGGAFLLMVSLKYFFDEEKKVHWIGAIEKQLSRWGGIAAIELTITLAAMLTCAAFSPHEALTILSGGVIGVVLFTLMETTVEALGARATRGALSVGAALFLYLETLDAAFSLDGVVAAFAITDNLPVIIGGLGIGALFVRAFTVRLVHRKTLETLIYLEHGAHWAIFALSLVMLTSIFFEIPDVFPGLVGLTFIVLAHLSSRRALRRG